jgi:hypothetical protein
MSATTGRFAIPRSRGVLTGGTIVILGIWGAIIPFVGPYFHYGFGSDAHLHFTWERLWLNVVPGLAAVLGGVLLITTANRPTGVLGGWLSALAGVWFIVGVSLSSIWQGAGNFGIGPALGGHLHQAAEWVGFFYGLGAAITFLAAFSMGRLSVLSVRDVDLSGDWADSEADRPDEHEADREQQIPAATA